MIVTSLLDLAISTLEVSLAVVLAAAAVEKLMDPAAWMRTLGNYRVAWLRRAQVANAVPLIELIVAAGLAFDVAVARVGAFVLFIGFAAVLLLALSRGASGACSCFGVVAQSQIDRAAVARAAALGLAALALVLTGAPSRVQGQPFLVITLVVAAIVGGELLLLSRPDLISANDRVVG
ncbi:MAG TPA: hypothetical protein DCK98_11575 [Chloroflexi bacterium]|nr:hypothetical protein [Chloroflexota bacterium]HAL28151.1 hypothetical protein [Chloroflexota bacterium]